MSRCFPYPPPYFGEAQIESIKKEKERLEVEAKKERKREKKEKKKEKKEKRSGKDHELSKELKKSIKRKYEELGLVESTDKHDSPEQHRSKKTRDEQLETSGLSEEHGLPSIKLGSPQRSHDSSKRSNLGRTPSPSVSLTNSGSTLRIKLQPKSRDFVPQPQTSKPKGSISTPQLVKSGELTRNREPVPVVQASKPRTTSVPQKPRADSVQQTLNQRASVVHTPKLKDPVLESPVPKPRDVVSHALKAVPKTNTVQKQLSSLKSETGLAQSSLVSRSSVSKESVIKAKNIEPCARSQVPKERAVIQKPLHAVRPKERGVAADGDSLPYVLKQDERPMVSGMPPVVPDEPCFSGRAIDAGRKRESKHHHRHSSKKSKRKEAEKLFEDLILNWKPAGVDQFQHGMEDLDWLMSGAKKRRVENEEGEDDEWLSKSSKCKAGGGLLDHTNGTSGSYQTQAVYMPQLDMYQLPYVVPF